jgi:hypothetical protein
MKDDASGYLLESPAMLIIIQDDLRLLEGMGERNRDRGIPEWGYVTVPEYFLCAYFCALEFDGEESERIGKDDWLYGGGMKPRRSTDASGMDMVWVEE